MERMKQIIFEKKTKFEIHTEDSGMTKWADFLEDNENEFFIRLHSYNESGNVHKLFDEICSSKKIKVIIEYE